MIRRYPRLFHMAEDGSFESIERFGLLSTTALLDLFEVSGERRFEIESRRRPETVAVEHPARGRALVRDNKPMNEKTLLKCLVDVSPREWYENLNGRVFFWTEKERLFRLLSARAYRERPHLVLEVDTAGLVERHLPKVSLSRINSGATFPLGAPPRGRDTFRRLEDFPEGEPVVELTVDYAVPDVRDLIVSKSRWCGARRLDGERED